jgi:hypothetical protein
MSPIGTDRMEDSPIGRNRRPTLAGREPATRRENQVYDPFVSPEPPPAPMAPAPSTPPDPTPGGHRLSGPRRALATALLSLGLVVVGGAAVVMAADPSPSTAPTPDATTAPANGGSGTAPATPSNPSTPVSPGTPGAAPHRGHGGAGGTGDCPNMGGSSGTNQGSGSGNGSAPAPQSSADPAQL